MKITEQDFVEAKNEARAEGLAEGRAEGRVEGRAEERTSVIDKVKLLIKKGMDAETLIETFNITGEERKMLFV